ncbi:MAG: hypothetical protein A2041_11070 [Bacteroidetes bacterium GWA2_31_9b]|nr:MAG: hypothetical protein A2041_11070 [Bacteroidetes bacterium GWA2_31_9b]
MKNCIFANKYSKLDTWNKHTKRLLKAELVKRGISIDDLVRRLNAVGIYETKSSINSKISRGTFSASFLIQCLNVIGCKNFDIEMPYNIAAEPIESYKTKVMQNEK